MFIPLWIPPPPNKALVHITATAERQAIAYELPSGAAASVDVIGGRAENAVLVPVEALHEIRATDNTPCL